LDGFHKRDRLIGHFASSGSTSAQRKVDEV
jgi:hypothetical protein